MGAESIRHIIIYFYTLGTNHWISMMYKSQKHQARGKIDFEKKKSDGEAKSLSDFPLPFLRGLGYLIFFRALGIGILLNYGIN